MGEKVSERLRKMAEILHWLERFEEAQLLAGLAVAMQLLELETIEAVNGWIMKLQEAK